MISIKTKLIHPDAKLPTRAHNTDAGFDLYCTHSHCNEFSFLK
nr:MAG TPA: deoxyuridine 5'-triphosphate nucleotidohydrolase [Caudoviricetes sp.]